MITKERLQEFIEQGATIYENKEGHISEIGFENANIRLGYKVYGIYLTFGIQNPTIIAQLENLFETKEDAEFALKFKRIPRTKYLDLPTWEEIEDSYNLEFGNSDFEVDKIKNRILVKTNKDYYSDLYDYIFDKPATKENYLEACEIYRKLWLGEEV